MTEKPPVNPDVHEIADRAKFGYARATQELASVQHHLTELAGTGQLDHEESMRLQHSLVLIWEALYDGTLCAVRDYSTSRHSWAEHDNTYSDGGLVVRRYRVKVDKDTFQYTRFLLRDGAATEFPLDLYSMVNPVPGCVPSSQVPGSCKSASVFDRLKKYRRDGLAKHNSDGGRQVPAPRPQRRQGNSRAT